MTTLVTRFWEEHLKAVLENHSTFRPPQWLVNFDLDFWPPLMAISDVISMLWGKDFLKDRIFKLAEETITSRKMEDSLISLEEKVLRATQAFVKVRTPMKKDPRFYEGQEMCEFVRKMIHMPKLPLAKISEILNNNHIVTKTWRPLKEVDDKERSTNGIPLKQRIQLTCYQLNQQKLSESLNKHFRRSNGK